MSAENPQLQRSSSPLAVAVLVSGSGSNLQAVIDQVEAKKLQAEIKIVISNVAKAYALERATLHGVPCCRVSHKGYKSRESFDRKINEILVENKVELVVLAGFMRLLSPWFVEEWKNRIINIHPSLLPAFPGLHAQRQALEAGVKVSGCSVFFVDSGMDTGHIIMQQAVPVLSEDTEESLSKRILEQEHRVLPQAIQWIAEGHLKHEGKRVITPASPF